jgi:hypothetical protein
MNNDPTSPSVETEIAPITAEEFDAIVEGLRLAAERLPRLSNRTIDKLTEFAMGDNTTSRN